MRTMCLRWSIAAVILLTLFAWGPAPGVDAATDYDSLAAAIQAANSSSEVSIMTLTADITLSEALPPITGKMTIEGNGHTISGDGAHRIFDVSGGRLTLNNVTLTKGRAPEAEYGGAIRVRYGGALGAQNVAFTNNSANFGGAIMMSGKHSRLTVRGSSFSGNRAREYAGAIYAIGEATISGSSFVANMASDSGGALVASNVNLDITNSSFHDNLATYNGGGIFFFGGDLTLTHVTMTGNRLSSGYSNAGSALAKQANMADEGPVRLRNSIVLGAGGVAACAGGLDEKVGNLSPDGTCSVKPSDNPMLDELTGSPAYHPLRDRSPAIDAADPAFCLETDQIGTARPQGDGCDIGAIESTTARPPEAPAVPPPPCPLADQIVAANTDAPSGGCRAGRGHDTIVLDADIELDRPLPVISSEITFEGRGHTIDGKRAFRIFDIDRGKLTINDLTLTNGTGRGFGGAIRLQNGGQLLVNDSSFIANFSSEGGAIGMMFTNWVTINNSVFLRNQAALGGGAISMTGGGTVNIRNSSFVNNFSRREGGAISAFSGRVSASNSSFISNEAGKGGALYVAGSWASGAVPITLTHVTMLNNWARTGSGIHLNNQSYSEIALSMRNSVIAGVDSSFVKMCSGRLSQTIRNLIEDGSCPSLLTGDAQLEEPGKGASYAVPRPGSPLIDAAHPELCSERDQIGQARPLGPGCDIGAFELMPAVDALSGCQVKTTHTLNLRETPGGRKLGTVPYSTTVPARERTPRWFQVDHAGRAGWISADYVTKEGDCDLE